MKISDVLWDAACRISDGEMDHSCPAIHSYIFKNSNEKRRPAKVFYYEYFSPSRYKEYWWRYSPSIYSQNERFFHLLSAYEMAKSDGL